MNNRYMTKVFSNKFRFSRILLENSGRLLCLLLFALIFSIPVYSQSEAFRVKSPNNASLFYVQSDGSVAVDTSTSLGSLTVNGNNGIIATGTFGSGNTLNLGAGTRMMWYPKKAAFRAGGVRSSLWDDTNIGQYSFATGLDAMASGEYSTAMGVVTTASGYSSTAMGEATTANGEYSTAMGYETIASGLWCTAIGSYASTNGFTGSFVYGDASTQNYVTSTSNNQFMVRAAGGYVLYTNSATTIGAELNPNQSAWSVISDSTKKENFIPVNGEDVLNKISKFNLRSWNYKGQNPRLYRHYGPMAQEFFKAFGHDKIGVIGNDTTINSADFAGINLIAIQALEKRTDKLQKKLKEKDNEILALNNNVSAIEISDAKLKEELVNSINANQNLNARLQQVENAVLKLKEVKVAMMNK